MTKDERDRIVNKKRADRNRLRLANIKLEKGCIDCGYKLNAFALEFDHLPGSKKNKTVASMCYQSWKEIEEEVKKCEIRCANCHAIKTIERKYSSKPIGGM